MRSEPAGLAVFLKNLKNAGLPSALVFSNVIRGFSDVELTKVKSVSSHVKSAEPVTLSASEKKATLSVAPAISEA